MTMRFQKRRMSEKGLICLDRRQEIPEILEEIDKELLKHELEIVIPDPEIVDSDDYFFKIKKIRHPTDKVDVKDR